MQTMGTHIECERNYDYAEGINNNNKKSKQTEWIFSFFAIEYAFHSGLLWVSLSRSDAARHSVCLVRKNVCGDVVFNVDVGGVSVFETLDAYKRRYFLF